MHGHLVCVCVYVCVCVCVCVCGRAKFVFLVDILDRGGGGEGKTKGELCSTEKTRGKMICIIRCFYQNRCKALFFFNLYLTPQTEKRTIWNDPLITELKRDVQLKSACHNKVNRMFYVGNRGVQPIFIQCEEYKKLNAQLPSIPYDG